MFCVSSSFEGSNFIGLEGVWEAHMQPCTIVNVYSPCNLEEKRVLWTELLERRRISSVASWCVAGDFNAVRTTDERKGHMVGSTQHRRESEEFNTFIAAMQLLDLPLIGRKYTWYRPNGSAMSRLDRFLLSQEWVQVWPNCSQVAFNRDVSDHCPILLRDIFQNWGPKPFRTLNCWFSHPKLREFVATKWADLRVQGRPMYVLKEKLKQLKGELKVWNKDVFGDVSQKLKGLVQQLNDFDLQAEWEDLSIEDVRRRQELLAEYWKVSKLNESILYQKSRIRWFQEGDANSEFFHASVNWKRRVNSIGA